MTIRQLIDAKLWEESYLTDKGEHLPVTKETTQHYQTKNPRWSVIFQPRPITTEDAANKFNPLSTAWRDKLIENNPRDENIQNR